MIAGLTGMLSFFLGITAFFLARNIPSGGRAARVCFLIGVLAVPIFIFSQFFLADAPTRSHSLSGLPRCTDSILLGLVILMTIPVLFILFRCLREQRAGLSSGPLRPHHYEFAHTVLRNHFFADPVAFRGNLIGRGDDLLLEMWAYVGDKMEEIGEERLPPEGLGLTVRNFGLKLPVLVVSLPPAEASPEAYFVGLIVDCADEGPSGLESSEGTRVGYITLERAHPGSGVETMVCAWESPSSHALYGPGPEPTLDAFGDVLRSLCRG